MSYARFGVHGSDVYVTVGGPGYICEGCSIGHDSMFATPMEMIAHLQRHRAEGHVVPDYAFRDLEEDVPDPRPLPHDACGSVTTPEDACPRTLLIGEERHLAVVGWRCSDLSTEARELLWMRRRATS